MSEAKIRGNQNTTALCNLLKTQQKQYPCLNKRQEREMIDQYRHDRDKLNKLLIMHNIRLVFNFAKNYMSKTDDYDTMVQDGMRGLAVAATRFDLDKNIKFSTYARIWIKKYVLMRFTTRTYKQDKKTISLDEPSLISGMKQNNGTEITFENYVNEYMDPCSERVLKTTEEQVSSEEMHTMCDLLYRRLEQDTSLSSAEKAVFTDLFVNREKPRDLAEKYNIQTKDVSDIRRRVLSKFRADLADSFGITKYSDIA